MKANFLLLCFSLLVMSGLYGQNNSFQGSFSSEQGFKFDIQQENGQYNGTFTVHGQSYPIKANLKDNTLKGTYPYNGLSVPFQISNSGGNYVLFTEGMQFELSYTPAGNSVRGALGSMGSQVAESSGAESATRVSSKVSGTKAKGVLIKEAGMGFSFNAPEGWIKQQANNDGYLFGHKSIPGLIVVYTHDYTDLQTVKNETQQNGIVDEGIVLSLAGEVRQYGNNGLIAEFQGQVQGESAKAVALCLLAQQGGGLIFMALTTSAKYNNDYVEMVKSMASSVEFFKPVETPIAQQWRQRIIGKKLVYYNTSSYSSTKLKISLYENGEFYYYSNTSASSSDAVSDFSYAGQNKNTGIWKITGRGQQATLILTYNDGSVSEYNLEPKAGSSGQILLNGSRYFITEMNSDH